MKKHVLPSLLTLHGQTAGHVSLNVPGKTQTLQNALAAIAFATEAGFDTDTIIRGLQSFGGTARRFEYKGKLGSITIIDDYAHHPTEIAATLTAARNYPHDRIICVFQPHTYTRTKAFWNQFSDSLALADVVVLADVYAARETIPLASTVKIWQMMSVTKEPKAIISHPLMPLKTFFWKNVTTTIW